MVTFKVKKNDVDSRNSKVIIGEKDLGISETESKIICNYCSRVVDVRLSDDEYFCNNCSVTIIPSLQEDVRRVQDIITPEGPNNINETSIASIPSPGDNDEDVRI